MNKVVRSLDVHVLLTKSACVTNKKFEFFSYRNAIIHVVAAVHGSIERVGKGSPSLVSDGESSHGIAGDLLVGEVGSQSDVRHVGESTTQRVTSGFQSVLWVLLHQGLDLGNDCVVDGGPGAADALHDLGTGGESDAGERGSHQGGVNIVEDILFWWVLVGASYRVVGRESYRWWIPS